MVEERSWAHYSTVEKGTTHRVRCGGGGRLWWSIGFSVALALVLGTTVMLYRGTEQRYREALQIARTIKPVDTSGNSISKWLHFSVAGPRSRRRGPSPMGEIAGPGIKIAKNFQWTWPHGSSPPSHAVRHEIPENFPGESLRLPLGIASSLSLARLEVDKLGDVDAGIRPRLNQNLLLNLGRRIPAVAALVADDAQTPDDMAGALAPKVRKDLERVLKIVAESHVQTEIPPQSPLAMRPCHPSASPTSACDKAHHLRDQLKNLEETSIESYQDVMQYPSWANGSEGDGEGGILYCGGFKGLKFDGHGTLFYFNPSTPAYVGDWRDGSMDGEGTIYNTKGVKVWQGQFLKGMPVENLFNILHNVHKGLL